MMYSSITHKYRNVYIIFFFLLSDAIIKLENNVQSATILTHQGISASLTSMFDSGIIAVDLLEFLIEQNTQTKNSEIIEIHPPRKEIKKIKNK